MEPTINKLADFQDLNQIARSAIIERLLKAKYIIDETALPYSDHMQDHWLRLWEYSGAIIESHLDKRMRVLDAGGTGTIFSYCMAFEGCEVHTIDIDEQKVADANKITRELRLNMEHSAQKIETMDYRNEYFDAVYSICVLEHIWPEILPAAVSQLARVLKPGGILSITFDWGKDAADFPILNADEVQTRLVEPSGLDVLGNQQFHSGSNDLHNTTIDYTFGALFLKKPGALFLEKQKPVIGNSIFESCSEAKMIYYG